MVLPSGRVQTSRACHRFSRKDPWIFPWRPRRNLHHYPGIHEWPPLVPREPARGSQDPFALRERGVGIKPVERLSDDDKIDRAVVESGVLARAVLPEHAAVVLRLVAHRAGQLREYPVLVGYPGQGCRPDDAAFWGQ